MPNLNQSLRDRVVRHELYLKRLANEEVRRTRELLVAAEADVQKQIERRMAWIAERGFDSSPFTLRRLEANLKEVRAVVRAAHRELGGQLRSSLIGVAKHEAGWAADAVAGELAGVGVELGVGVAEGPLLNAIVNKQPFQGALLKDWAAKLGEDTYHAVRGAVRQGLLQGEAIGDIVRRLRGTQANGFKDGVLAIRRRNAEAVVRTAVSSVANSAREATWKANDDLVKGVQWVSTLDDRTTPQCQIRDGLVYTLDYEPRGHSVPWGDGPGALHWNCRSTSVPVLATWRELGIDAREVTGEQRAALDGMVPSTQNFGEWLGHMRDQGRLGLVEEVLGKKRAAAFMAGQIKFKDLFNQKGDFLTLEQLRAADPGFREAERVVAEHKAAQAELARAAAKAADDARRAQEKAALEAQLKEAKKREAAAKKALKAAEKKAAELAAAAPAQASSVHTDLSSGRIVAEKALGGSLNAVRRVTLEASDGSSLVGYWKPAVPKGGMEGGFVRNFLKNAGGTHGTREVLASELDEALGLGLVPPTAAREIVGVAGTIQLEASSGAKVFADSYGTPRLSKITRAQKLDLSFFDMILGNGDRHGGNLMVGAGGELFAIDNGLTMTAPGARLRFDVSKNWWHSPIFNSFAPGTMSTELTEAERTLWLSRLENPKLQQVILDNADLSSAAKEYAQRRIDALHEAVNKRDWRKLYSLFTMGGR